MLEAQSSSPIIFIKQFLVLVPKMLFTDALTWALALTFSSPVQAGPTKPTFSSSRHPTRKIAGVSVINTPLVRAAEAFAREHNEDGAFKHVMRSWLYGTLTIQANQTLRDEVDLEVHAVATILHDLGWDASPGSSLVSADRRFEVDGAIAARDFVERHQGGGGSEARRKRQWNEQRLQLLWDAIALHTQPSISMFKELEVQTVAMGILQDFLGPSYGVSASQHARVNAVYPKQDLKNTVNETIIRLCRSKPSTTYGEFPPSPPLFARYRGRLVN